MNSLQGVTPSFEISVMQFSKTTFIKLFVTLGYAFVGYSHRFRRRTCHTVRKLLQNEPHMDGQAPAVEVIGLVAEQIEKLAIHEGGHKVKGAVRIREDHEQRRFAVAQGVKLQFVRFHQVPELFYIKGGKPGPAGNQYAFECLASNKMSIVF